MKTNHSLYDLNYCTFLFSYEISFHWIKFLRFYAIIILSTRTNINTNYFYIFKSVKTVKMNKSGNFFVLLLYKTLCTVCRCYFYNINKYLIMISTATVCVCPGWSFKNVNYHLISNQLNNPTAYVAHQFEFLRKYNFI